MKIEKMLQVTACFFFFLIISLTVVYHLKLSGGVFLWTHDKKLWIVESMLDIYGTKFPNFLEAGVRFRGTENVPYINKIRDI